MRRLLPLLTLAFLLALPSGGRAQDVEEPEETAVEDEPGYEPDQRGGHEEGGEGGDSAGGGEETGTDTTTGEGEYEPDQRGEHDPDRGGEAEELDYEAEPTVMTADSAPEDAGYGGYGDGGGRGVGFYTQLFLGAGLTSLDAITGDNLVTPTQQGGPGFSFGLGLGLRVGPISVGPRVGFTADPSFLLGTVGLDVAADLLRGDFVPTLRLGVGYAFASSLSDALPSQGSVGGLYTELGAGFRYYVDGPFHFGAELSGGWLALFRGEEPGCEDPCTDTGSFDLRRPGEAHGLTLRLHIVGGFAF